GSLGIDLAAAVTITLIDTGVHQIPTGISGPLVDENRKIDALLIGRSSAGLAGLIVLPGVIDADYTGEIMVCAYTLMPPLTVNVGTRIAQLVLYPKMTTKNTDHLPRHGNQGFGSTGSTVVNLAQQMKHRPMTDITLSTSARINRITTMLDTGADFTIIN
ncbi:POK9 protein, partial [Gymnorhina tibicen]|nr:POK9 protein [Gymnorhina tibicen]